QVAGTVALRRFGCRMAPCRGPSRLPLTCRNGLHRKEAGNESRLQPAFDALLFFRRTVAERSSKTRVPRGPPADHSNEAADMSRIEKDFLGSKEIPDDAYYGVQTLRGKENFHITGIPMSTEPNFVKAFGYVKKAAALANRDLGVLDARVADAIVAGCDR